MVDVNAINQDPARYFNQKDLTNPWAVPVVTQALYDQGKISKLDAAALSMNPMMAPVIAPAIQMTPPLKTDTVNFTVNTEYPEQETKTSTAKKAGIGALILGAVGIAAYFITKRPGAAKALEGKAGKTFVEAAEANASVEGKDIAKIYAEAFANRANKLSNVDINAIKLTAKNDLVCARNSMQGKIAKIKETSTNPAQELYDLSKTLEKQPTPESYLQTIVLEEELLNNYASSLAKSNDTILKRIASNVANHYISVGDLNEANKIAAKFGLA